MQSWTSQSYGASLDIWNHTVLPVSRCKCNAPCLTSARLAGTWLTYPEGMKGWVHRSGLLHTKMVHLVTHPSSNQAPNMFIMIPPLYKQKRKNVQASEIETVSTCETGHHPDSHPISSPHLGCWQTNVLHELAVQGRRIVSADYARLACRETSKKWRCDTCAIYTSKSPV